MFGLNTRTRELKRLAESGDISELIKTLRSFMHVKRELHMDDHALLAALKFEHHVHNLDPDVD